MTFDTLVRIGLDVAFFGVFAVTLVDWLRHRGPVRRAVLLVFASTAVVLAVPVIRILVPAVGRSLDGLVVPALFAQPLLVLWLVNLVRPVPRLALALAAVAWLALTVGIFGLSASGAEPRSLPVVAYAIAAVAYFGAVDGAAALGFALAARGRAGASRSRLLIAAGSTALLGLAVVVLLGGGLATAPGSEAASVTGVVARTIALFAALGYLAAFAPPRLLRRISQQAIVYEFIRELNALPTGTPVDRIWALLADTVRRASGARRVEVVERGASVGDARSSGRTISMTFTSQRWPDGRLELELPRHSLFLEDDLELTHLLMDRAVRAAEREAIIVEREVLIRELRAASAAKSDFLAAMSHELRTPLNAIIGFSELLSEGGEDAADPPTVASYAEHIHGSGLHLLELVNDVLDLARVEAGRLDLRRAEFELDDLVRQTVAAISPLAAEKGQHVTLELTPVTVDADPSRVRQVVLNLVSNAIKFTGEGGEIRLGLDVAGSGAIRLTVSDTGRGIAPADLERVFEAFHQGDGDGRAPRQEGSGLGLALTRQLVEAHGGTIWASSEVGKGSEFTVLLPVGPASAIEAAAHPPAVPTDRPRVLVIEDDLAAQELLRRHLEDAGYAVLATSSGSQGLAWLGQVRPEAVILDILLPDLDGWEILARAKSNPATRSIPIMVVSVLDDRELGLALGAVDYFVKPVSRDRLVEALGRLTFTTKVRTRTVTALVIDGDAADVAHYRELLEPDGFQVIAAADGKAGLRRAHEDKPDLVLVNALLPDMDGFELANTLRHDAATAGIPIWLTTPAGLAPEAKARLNGTVQGVLARGDDALAALRGWLDAGGLARPAGGVPT